jgi:epsilon-lactone hydrolase
MVRDERVRQPAMSLRMKVFQRVAVAVTNWTADREPDIPASRRAVLRMERHLRLARGVRTEEGRLAGVAVRRFSSGGDFRGVVLHLHGGAYYCGSSAMGRCYSTISALGGPEMVSVDYRLAPEHPYPAALDDALAVYRALLPGPVVVIGESAGGGLALALVQRLRDEGLPRPVGVVATFPWADLTQSSASYEATAGHDLMTKEAGDWAAGLYAAGQDVRTPGISPRFGSFAGFPPTLVTVGTGDALLDDARGVTEALGAAGVEVTVNEVPGGIHGFTTLPTPEARDAIQVMAYFVRDCLRGPGRP